MCVTAGSMSFSVSCAAAAAVSVQYAAAVAGTVKGEEESLSVVSLPGDSPGSGSVNDHHSKVMGELSNGRGNNLN